MTLRPTDSDDDFEKCLDEAEWECQRSAGSPMSREAWGIYTWFDDPWHPVGGFNWFNSRDELLAYISRHLPFLARLDTHLPECADIAASVCDGEIPVTECADRLTAVLGPAARIDWVGQAYELLTCQSRFCATLRSLYRSSSSRGDPIAAEEEPRFLAMLRDLPDEDWAGG